MNTGLSIEVKVPSEGVLVASEGEHRKWDRNGEIDTNLSDFDLVLEFSCDSTVLSENCGSIAPFVSVQ